MTMVYDKAKATVQYTVSNDEAEMIQEDNAQDFVPIPSMAVFRNLPYTAKAITMI